MNENHGLQRKLNLKDLLLFSDPMSEAIKKVITENKAASTWRDAHDAVAFGKHFGDTHFLLVC